MASFADIARDLERQWIELPSWAFGNSGTRFKVFAQPGVPRTPQEKLEDGEILPDRDSGDAEPARELADAHASVLLDEAGDMPLPLLRECLTGAVGLHRGADLQRAAIPPGRHWFRLATIDDCEPNCQQGN